MRKFKPLIFGALMLAAIIKGNLIALVVVGFVAIISKAIDEA